MRITYTGRQVELAPAQLKKIEAIASRIGGAVPHSMLARLAPVDDSPPVPEGASEEARMADAQSVR